MQVPFNTPHAALTFTTVFGSYNAAKSFGSLRGAFERACHLVQ